MVLAVASWNARSTITWILVFAVYLGACSQPSTTPIVTDTDCADPACVAAVLSQLKTRDRIQIKTNAEEYFGAEFVSFEDNVLVVKNKWYGPGLHQGDSSNAPKVEYASTDIQRIELLTADPTGQKAREGRIGLVVVILATIGLLALALATSWLF